MKEIMNKGGALKMSECHKSASKILEVLREKYRKELQELNVKTVELAEQSQKLQSMEVSFSSHSHYNYREVRDEQEAQRRAIYSQQRVTDRLSEEVDRCRERLEKIRIKIAEAEEKAMFS